VLTLPLTCVPSNSTNRPKTTVRPLPSFSPNPANLLLLLPPYPSFSPPFSPTVYLVTDLCQGGELFDRICAKSYFLEDDAAKLVSTVFGAVEYLHSHGIVHRGAYYCLLPPLASCVIHEGPGIDECRLAQTSSLRTSSTARRTRTRTSFLRTLDCRK
jgi:hypothetical protein